MRPTGACGARERHHTLRHPGEGWDLRQACKERYDRGPRAIRHELFPVDVDRER